MSNSLLGDYFQFLRSPDLISPPVDSPWGKKLRYILRLYAPHLLLIVGVGMVIQSFGMVEQNVALDIFDDMSAWLLLLFASVIAPIVEEAIFRLPLYPLAANLVLSASVVGFALLALARVPMSLLAFVTAMLAGFNVYYWGKSRKSYAATSLAATSGVATSVETKSSETKSSETKSVGIAKFYQRYPRLIFYVLTLLFGAIHITNYTPEALPLLPLLVLPQVILGLLLGFVRLRYGFLWAILLHSFHNSCVLLPIAVLKIFGSASFQSQGLEGDVEALPMADQLLMGGVGLYTLGGLVLCLIVSWKMLKELKRA